MENTDGIRDKDDQLSLPPGFRFHPTDEELITHYLCKKVHDGRFCAIAIGEADLNKSEPWELPWKAKIGEKEWYFFVLRDKKYPTGLRTNRATQAGYWKATGKDKEIYRGKYLVGMKKTLVFYKGRAPKGEKSNWVMHEYRLEGNLSLHNLPETAKTEWVICRVFQKSSGGKKIHISGLMKFNSFNNVNNEFNDPSSGLLPPLMDSSPSKSLYVPCFSNPIMNNNLRKPQEEFLNYFNNNTNTSNAPSNNQYYVSHMSPIMASNIQQYPQNSFMMQQQQQDEAILRSFLLDQNNAGSNYMMRQHLKTERDIISVSQETGLTNNDNLNQEISSIMPFDHDQEDPCSSVAPVVDLECLWSY